MRNFILILLACVSALSCSENKENYDCIETGFSREKICVVSFDRLNQPLDQRVIQISGYYRVIESEGKRYHLLFSSEERSKVFDLSNALVIGGLSKSIDRERVKPYERVLNQDGIFVAVSGKFSSQLNQVGDFGSARGSINNVVGVSVVADRIKMIQDPH